MTDPKTGAEEVVWDLSILYAGIEDPVMETNRQQLKQVIESFAQQYQGQVAKLDAAQMCKAMETLEQIYARLHQLMHFSGLMHAVHSNDPEIGALVQKTVVTETEYRQKLLFFELEWKQMEDAQIQKILNDPRIGQYRHLLETELALKPYTLSHTEENLLLATHVSGRLAWVRFFTQLTSSMRYDWDEERVPFSIVAAKLFNPDRNVRQRAAKSMTQTLQDKQMELTFIHNTLTSDKATTDHLRHYPSWITSRNLSNQVADEIVETLVQTVTDNYSLVARHYTLKKKIMGLDELYEYDRYAPVNLDEDEKFYTWDQSKDIVLRAFGQFDSRMVDITNHFFDHRRIHAPVKPNKVSGAFCWGGTPSTDTYILMNYTGKLSSIKTLAHELGHGIHSHLAIEKQGYLLAQTPLTTAEMASTFCEMLVFDDLLSQETDSKIRLAMFMERIEENFATVFRQISMNRFEDAMHNTYRAQGELTTEQISAIWMDTQRAMFGDSVTLQDDYGLWWSYIPHFLHTPGYVYAYAFGELLAMSLFERYKAQGASFVAKYIDVLASGGSDYPDRILAKVDVDLTDPLFWQGGINIVKQLIEEEEQLAHTVFPDKF